jgi:catechol 2,3-dioxygenase-like lactoylglutathione lyase family enzyme
MPLPIVGLDHLVLRCNDVEATIRWYEEKVGLEPVRLAEWRRGEVPFPSLRVDATTIIDLIPGDTADGRLDHICLVLRGVELDTLAASGDFEVLNGPAERFGARGTGRSIYVRDPDGLTLELRTYPT